METPKPKPFKNTNNSAKDEKPAPVKRPFVRQEHLTTKPFRDSAALRELQSKMNRKTNKVINPKAQRQR